MSELIFRFCAYVGFGLLMEMTSNLWFTDFACGLRIKRRFPRRWLEGMVSFYMIPLHGFGLLFLYEPVHSLIGEWNIFFRYLVWCLLFTAAETTWGFLIDKIFGYYPWEYYAKSKYRVFKRGYTLWTLIPAWGIAGLVIEHYSAFLLYLSPFVKAYFH